MAKLKLCTQLMLNDRSDCDIEALDVAGDRLYTSAEGGVIKMWTCDNLTMIGELNANKGAVLSMLVDGNTLYASHTDSSIVVWDLEKKNVIRELIHHTEPVSVLRLFKNQLYSGDYEGKIGVWDVNDGKFLKEYETSEEMWDMAITDDHLYSIRDRDLLVQTHQKQVKRTIEGRGPICVTSDKICMPTRDGLNIQVFDEKKFTLLKTLQGNDRIINAIGCSPDGNRLYSGGWDNCVHVWDLNSFAHLDQCDVGQAVNQIRVHPTSGDVYVAGNSGLIAKLVNA